METKLQSCIARILKGELYQISENRILIPLQNTHSEYTKHVMCFVVQLVLGSQTRLNEYSSPPSYCKL